MPLTDKDKNSIKDLNAINKKIERLLKERDLLVEQLEQEAKSIKQIKEVRSKITKI